MAQYGRQNRILTGSHYKAVFNNRLRFHSRFFSFHLLPNDASHSRLGIAVSKKVSKLAVERNRIKRQIRDSFRYYLAAESVQTHGTDFVLVAKASVQGADNHEIRSDLDENWEKALKYAKQTSQPSRRRGRDKKPDVKVQA